MPKKFSLVDSRDWLEAYEKGESQVSIARRAHCDVRTVKKGIEQAQRERDAASARAELLEDALRSHQDALMGVVNGLLSAPGVPSLNLTLRAEPDATPKPITLPGGTATFEPGKGWTVTLQSENTTMWELLREHLKRDTMWDAVANWKKALALHIEAAMALKKKTEALLVEKTGCELVEEPTTPPFVYSYTTVGLIYQSALRLVLGIRDGTDLENTIVAHPVTGEIKHGAATTLAQAHGGEEECARKILDAFRELQISDEAMGAAQTYREAEESARKARRAVEEISLLGLVPGQCRVCRRLGL